MTEAATAGPPADIRLRGLTKRFGDVVAVDAVDLDIAPGEFFTLLGPSGSGKTTTLRMIAGFEQPDEGSIELAGEDVSRLPPYDRPVNTVFQDYALFPHMTVQQNVEYGLMVKKVSKGDRRHRAEQALQMVRLARATRDRKPSQLSGGQRQRVALARAIVNRPRVLLLDEPLGALDLKLRQEMQVELKQIQREVGITFVYVTHDQEEALTMSDRLAVFNEGKDRADRAAGPRLRASADGVHRSVRRRLERHRAGRPPVHREAGEDPHPRSRPAAAGGLARGAGNSARRPVRGAGNPLSRDAGAGGDLEVLAQNLEEGSTQVLEVRKVDGSASPGGRSRSRKS